MDVAGSGRVDLVQIWTGPAGELHATTYLSLPTRDGIEYQRSGDTVLGSFGHQHQVLQGDFDGDGRQDLLVAYAGGAGRELRLAVFLSNGAGFAPASMCATGESFSPRHLAFFALDADGDGRCDLVQVFERSDGEGGGLLTFRTFLSRCASGQGAFTDGLVAKTGIAARPAGQVFGFWPLAANGSPARLTRVHRRAGDDHILAETFLAAAGEPFATVAISDLGAFPLANDPIFFPADVDGDGLPDLVQAYGEEAESGSRLHLVTAFGRADGRFVAGPESIFEGSAAGAFHLLAAADDPAPLLLRRYLGAGRLKIAAYRATPAGFFRKAGPFDAGPAVPGIASARFLVGDADGDGHDDLIRLRSTADGVVEVLPYLLEAARSGPREALPSRRSAFPPGRRERSESAAGG